MALFAGAGGGLLATKWFLGWRTICYVENAEYPVEILKARIRDGLLDDAPIWSDARTFDGKPWRGCVDIITAGFPCQPFSAAGKMLADKDDRNLWPDTIRIIREIQPEWIFLENVPALLSKSHGYFGHILGDLAESGHDAWWRVLSAAEVGAPHKRDRLWINVADSNGERKLQSARELSQEWGWTGNSDQRVANSDSTRRVQQGAIGGQQEHAYSESSSHGREWWSTEPDVGRVVNGLAHRVDRLRAIGNGQVPAVAAVVWNLLNQHT